MNDGLQERPERERRIAAISASLLAATTEEEFCHITLRDVAAAFGGYGIVLALAENGRLRTPLLSELSEIDPRFACEMNGMLLNTAHPLTEAIQSGESRFVTREEYAKRWPDWRHQLGWSSAKSASFVPFGASGHPVMGGWVMLHDGEQQLTADVRTLMRTLGHLAGQALERIRSQEVARVLQRSMLPPLLEELPGLEVVARYAPARDGLEVGGDWYDAFALADGTVALVIGDVQGHDVDAATVMGQVRTSIRAFASLEGDPSIVLQRTNDLLVRMAVPNFASSTFMRYDPRTGTVQAASAGHIPPVCVYQDGSHGLLEIEGGPVLGVMCHAKYPALAFSLEPVALLALVTDGVVEGPHQPFEAGLEHLCSMAALALRESAGLEGIADRLLAATATVGHVDDAAVLLVRPFGNGKAGV